MADRNPKTANRRRNPEEKPPSRPRALSWLLFWPFHLWQKLTKNLPWYGRLPFRLLGYAIILGLMVAAPMSLFYYVRATQFDLSKVVEMPERTMILDRNGEEIGRIQTEQRDIVPLSQVAEPFRKAIVAREDERFYKHGPVDWLGFARATLRNLKDRGATQGASTITMQLARNTFPLGKGNFVQELDRKFLEIAVSFRIEHRYSKDEILEAYVNRIFWGHSIMGIQEASRIYFEKNASQLTLSESALLAGIVRGPNAFSPFNDLSKAIRERNTTLDRMVEAEAITQEQAEAAKKEAIVLRPETRRVTHDSFAMDVISRDLRIILDREEIDLGGLTVVTTIDNRIQKKAEEALDTKLRAVESAPGYPHLTRAKWQKLPEQNRPTPEYIQGAVVVMDNAEGGVVAIVGGRSADESKFNRAIDARRQIGSLFKPFVYLSAFDKGLRPQSYISDDPISSGEIKGAPSSWHPKNSDGKYTGMHQVGYGLVRSRNTMSVRVGNYAGLDNVAKMARSVGLNDNMPMRPSSYLGSWEATPWQVASAYTVFPRQGEKPRPFIIKEIRNRKGTVLYSTPVLPYEAAKPGSAWTVSNILTEVTTSGTASTVKRLGFDKPCAGKTGTTNDFKDAWFAGYTSSLTCVVWVGMDTPTRTVSGGYGATLALPVWVEVMKTAHRLDPYKAGSLDQKIKLVDCKLCKSSGKWATAGCDAAGTSYRDRVPADTAPPTNDLCPIHPARALPVSPDDVEEPPSIGERPMRAVPVEEEELPPAQHLRAEPVEQPQRGPLRAVPVR